MSQLILFTHQITERLKYTSTFVFKTVLGIEHEITMDETFFKASSLFKVNYANLQIEESDLHIYPSGILHETDIRSQNLRMGEWLGLPCFFLTDQGPVSFDMLSAVFYLLSRYEEYLPYEKDIYQRFPVENSLAFHHNFLNIPLVDIWIAALKKLIQQKSTTVHFPDTVMKYIPTYDIDMAYSYRGKGFLRNAGGMLKELIHAQFSQISKRIKVLSGTERDPFDSFEMLDEIHRRHSLSPVYFFLLSEGGPLDKNIDPSHPLMEKLIASIKSTYQIGIHPSYQSNDNRKVFENEMRLLSTEKSRQHYIRFSLPSTYRSLIEAGIREDYSMGYGSVNGFRAGTAYPHDWFDLLMNKTSQLKVFPFCYMECNSFFEQHYTAEEAYLEMMHYQDAIEKTGGTYITIWHNFSLGTDPQWTGWKEAYELFLKNRIV